MSTYIQNRKAHFDFEILETFEAGLVLSGFEVKAIRSGKGKLDGAFVKVRGGEAFLIGASVSSYQVANTPKSYDPERVRKLLLSKKELAHLERQTETAGLTAIPLKLYNVGRNIKLELAIARGKKKFDKRETFKERDTKRDIERTLKGQ
ncbi:MAG: SsrA-binding protein SmpB [Candidatus Pacebacteria bacterium]|nr:SsrA-binding protein SmpB [Candidatus Paceibacterota bacterium]